MLGTVLIVILILALLGALPRWPHSRGWGYYPTGGVGLILFVVVVLLVLATHLNYTAWPLFSRPGAAEEAPPASSVALTPFLPLNSPPAHSSFLR